MLRVPTCLYTWGDIRFETPSTGGFGTPFQDKFGFRLRKCWVQIWLRSSSKFLNTNQYCCHCYPLKHSVNMLKAEKRYLSSVRTISNNAVTIVEEPKFPDFHPVWRRFKPTNAYIICTIQFNGQDYGARSYMMIAQRFLFLNNTCSVVTINFCCYTCSYNSINLVVGIICFLAL